jgi:hypothetical protein
MHDDCQFWQLTPQQCRRYHLRVSVMQVGQAWAAARRAWRSVRWATFAVWLAVFSLALALANLAYQLVRVMS